MYTYSPANRACRRALCKPAGGKIWAVQSTIYFTQIPASTLPLNCASPCLCSCATYKMARGDSDDQLCLQEGRKSPLNRPRCQATNVRLAHHLLPHCYNLLITRWLGYLTSLSHHAATPMGTFSALWGRLWLRYAKVRRKFINGWTTWNPISTIPFSLRAGVSPS